MWWCWWAGWQVANAVNTVGLGGARVPILLPGAVRPLALAPYISDEDRLVIANTTKLVNFLSGSGGGGGAAGPMTAESARLLLSLAPLMPAVAQQIVPELTQRLGERVAARLIQDVFLDTQSIAVARMRSN
jgi:aarF domain-containing kinase